MRPEQLAVVERALGGTVEVRDVRRLSAGASRQTWRIEVTVDGVARTVICQRERPGGARSASGLAGEAALLSDLGDRGVPVAGVLAADARGVGEADELGSWILLEEVPGETIPRRILTARPDPSSRRDLLVELAVALAGIHRLEPSRRHGLVRDDQLAAYRGVLDVLGDPRPTFELAFAWLETHGPPGPSRGEVGVVHGDFRLGNVVVDDTGLRAVLDWELAHLGDPVEDLAWCCLRAWRFGAADPAAGLGSVQEFVAAYEAAGGRPVDPVAFRWWQVLGTLKWGIMCLVQAASHQAGSGRSVELAAIGRRVAEVEEDLLDLLDGPHWYQPESESPVGRTRWAGLGGAAGPAVRPPADELLEAVGEYLRTVRDEVPGRTGFMARVAANVVDQVGREVTLGPGVAERHRVRLDSLGVADDAELAARIRAGVLTAGDRPLLDALRGTVRDTLSVVHPGYWEAT